MKPSPGERCPTCNSVLDTMKVQRTDYRYCQRTSNVRTINRHGRPPEVIRQAPTCTWFDPDYLAFVDGSA